MSRSAFPWDVPVCVCAEVGNNHNGDINKAKEMIRRAADAGAHAVKFQMIHPETLVHPDLLTVAHAKGLHATQLERLKSICLQDSAIVELYECAQKNNIIFLSTPFDERAVDVLDPFVPAFKVSSGDITHIPLLKHIASKKKPVILSTGMASHNEIKKACSIFRGVEVMLLHCVTQYPTPDSSAHLLRIPYLQEHFKIPVGYSDHVCGISASVYAAVLGATFIEKHFTLDKTLPRGDHALSADPDDLRKLVSEIGRIERMKGICDNAISSEEAANRRVMRRSLYAAKGIEKGERITREAIAVLRPEDGLSPDGSDRLIGKTARVAIQEGTVLKREMFTR
ncbi:MAG: N-acetylneuraminate synthase family protein [Candidatus Omnitrophica bacterium]|nr:N-acetylneuraminate synthase family protein [Candidatus Omnitrophota bacterium]